MNIANSPASMANKKAYQTPSFEYAQISLSRVILVSPPGDVSIGEPGDYIESE